MAKSRAYHGGRIYETPHGTYQAVLSRWGMRQRTTHPTIAAAREWIDVQNTQIDAETNPLSATEIKAAIVARGILPPEVALDTCARFWMAHNRAVVAVAPADALEQYIFHKEEQRLARVTVNDARVYVGKFLTEMNSPLTEITQEMITAYIRRTFAEDQSRNALRMKLNTFFEWARVNKYVSSNPVEEVPIAKVVTAKPVFLPVDDVIKFMRHIEEHAPEIVPYCAVGFWAGCRSSELDLIRGDQFVDGELQLEAHQTKTRDRRFVKLEPNLVAWLAAYPPGRTLRLPQRAHRLLFRDAVFNSGVAWERNTMRRTFASYHVAAYQNAARTAELLGHQNQRMLYKHYRGVARQDEGLRYWGVVPG